MPDVVITITERDILAVNITTDTVVQIIIHMGTVAGNMVANKKLSLLENSKKNAPPKIELYLSNFRGALHSKDSLFLSI